MACDVLLQLSPMTNLDLVVFGRRGRRIRGRQRREGPHRRVIHKWLSGHAMMPVVLAKRHELESFGILNVGGNGQEMQLVVRGPQRILALFLLQCRRKRFWKVVFFFIIILPRQICKVEFYHAERSR